MPQRKNWHLFCRVIDNFGDIGVCWRLAQQLSAEHHKQVTLWLDDLPSLHRLCPAIDPHQEQQLVAGVMVRHWPAHFPVLESDGIAEVVIEAFACELPVVYRELMKCSNPRWINLEYLSAETWVADFHLRQSPVAGMRKTFFFPGFVTGTGGVLHDQWLRAATDSMDEDCPDEDRSRNYRELSSLGIDPRLAVMPLQISLFAYENAALPQLLNALTRHSQEIHLMVPEGRISAAVRRWCGTSLCAGQHCCRDALVVSALPFLSQLDYDRLLMSCDLSFVRGEDSFVRAQVMAKPLIWQIYPQQEDAHLAKLKAFVDLYLAQAPPDLANVVRRAQWVWNQQAPGSVDDWSMLLEQLPAWRRHARHWRRHLLEVGDLASNLVHFSSKSL